MEILSHYKTLIRTNLVLPGFLFSSKTVGSVGNPLILVGFKLHSKSEVVNKIRLDSLLLLNIWKNRLIHFFFFFFLSCVQPISLA